MVLIQRIFCFEKQSCWQGRGRPKLKNSQFRKVLLGQHGILKKTNSRDGVSKIAADTK